MQRRQQKVNLMEKLVDAAPPPRQSTSSTSYSGLPNEPNKSSNSATVRSSGDTSDFDRSLVAGTPNRSSSSSSRKKMLQHSQSAAHTHLGATTTAVRHGNVLGVDAGTASQEEIKKAYKKLALESHPDRNPTADPAQFQRIQNAYAALRTDGGGNGGGLETPSSSFTNTSKIGGSRYRTVGAGGRTLLGSSSSNSVGSKPKQKKITLPSMLPAASRSRIVVDRDRGVGYPRHSSYNHSDRKVQLAQQIQQLQKLQHDNHLGPSPALDEFRAQVIASQQQQLGGSGGGTGGGTGGGIGGGGSGGSSGLGFRSRLEDEKGWSKYDGGGGGSSSGSGSVLRPTAGTVLQPLHNDRAVLNAVLKAFNRPGDGCVFQLQSLLDEGHPILQCVDSHRNTLLLMAAKRGKIYVIEWLDEIGALDLDERNKQLHTVLHVAAAANQLEVMEWLLARHSALLHAVDRAGQTALHTAAAAGKKKACTMLVDAGADLEWRDGRQDTALIVVAGKNDYDMIHHLARLGADVNARTRRDYTALLLAASRRAVKTVKALGMQGADLEVRSGELGWPALLTAAAKGFSDVVDVMAGLGASVEVSDDLGSPAIFLAAQQGHLATVQVLALHGADLRRSEGGHDLCNYYAARHPEVLAWCRFFAGKEEGDEDNGGGGRPFTPLHVAAALRRVDKIEALVRDGVGFGFHSLRSPTPFTIASEASGYPGAKAINNRAVQILTSVHAPWSPQTHRWCSRWIRARIWLMWMVHLRLSLLDDSPYFLPPELWQKVCQMVWGIAVRSKDGKGTDDDDLEDDDDFGAFYRDRRGFLKAKSK